MPFCCLKNCNNNNNSDIENANANGSTGENYDEPSSYVAPPPLGIFDECDPTFYMFSLIHCKYGMFVAAITGILGTCAVFGISLCFFRWYFYETTVDIIAVTGFSVFLLSGVFVHILVLQAINRTKAVLLTPFIIFHAFLLLMETIMALTAVGQIVSDQDAHIDESDVLAREILLTSPFCILLQVLMLYCGIKFRNYARRKEAHDHTTHSINPVLSFQNTVSPTASFDISDDKC